MLDLQQIKLVCLDDTVLLTDHAMDMMKERNVKYHDMIWIITTYYPNLDKWEDDYKTRKVAK